MSRKNILICVGASVASAAAAGGATWFLANRILEQKYEDRFDTELRSSLNYILKEMGINHVIATDEDPDEVAARMNDEAALEIVDVIVAEQEYAGETPEEILEETEKVLDIFAPVEDLIQGERVFWSQEEKPSLDELTARNQKVPYHKILTPDLGEPEPEVDLPEPPPENPDISVISRDIFMENGSEWPQESLTYFSDEGVIDVRGDFVENHTELIGIGRPPFGEMSEDSRVVYLRNKKLEREFEVVFDPGKSSDFLAHSLVQMFKPSWQT